MVDGRLLLALERELERLGADEFDLQAEERRRVLVWRALQFRELGFDDPTSAVLADAPADLGRARGLVAAGCPLELASRILL